MPVFDAEKLKKVVFTSHFCNDFYKIFFCTTFCQNTQCFQNLYKILVKVWNGCPWNFVPTNIVYILSSFANPQVSFNYGHDSQGNDVARTLSGLDRDCFIIPVHSLDRFLPAGVPMPVGTTLTLSTWLFRKTVNVFCRNRLRVAPWRRRRARRRCMSWRWE